MQVTRNKSEGSLLLKRRSPLSSPFQQPFVNPLELSPVLSLLEVGHMGEAIELNSFPCCCLPRPLLCLQLLLAPEIGVGDQRPQCDLLTWDSSVLCLFHPDRWGKHSSRSESVSEPVQIWQGLTWWSCAAILRTAELIALSTSYWIDDPVVIASFISTSAASCTYVPLLHDTLFLCMSSALHYGNDVGGIHHTILTHLFTEWQGKWVLDPLNNCNVSIWLLLKVWNLLGVLHSPCSFKYHRGHEHKEHFQDQSRLELLDLIGLSTDWRFMYMVMLHIHKNLNQIFIFPIFLWHKIDPICGIHLSLQSWKSVVRMLR